MQQSGVLDNWIHDPFGARRVERKIIFAEFHPPEVLVPFFSSPYVNGVNYYTR